MTETIFKAQCPHCKKVSKYAVHGGRQDIMRSQKKCKRCPRSFVVNNDTLARGEGVKG